MQQKFQTNITFNRQEAFGVACSTVIHEWMSLNQAGLVSLPILCQCFFNDCGPLKPGQVGRHVNAE